MNNDMINLNFLQEESLFRTCLSRYQDDNNFMVTCAFGTQNKSFIS